MREKWKKLAWTVATLLGVCTLLGSDTEAAEMSSRNSAIVSVESYKVEEGSLNPGEEITIKLKIKNNSAVAPAQNVIITFDSNNYALVPVYGEGNQAYIDSIAPNDNVELSVKAKVNTLYDSDMAQLRCHFTYISGSEMLNNETTLCIPTYVSGNLIAESVVVAENATVGVNTLVSVRYKNSSSVDITDAKLIIDGNINEESKEIELPTVGAGKTYTNDYYVSFEQNGIQTLVLQYSYTDAQGNSYVTDCGEYKVNVTKGVQEYSDAVIKEESNMVMQAVKLALLAIAGVIIVVVVTRYIKKRK